MPKTISQKIFDSHIIDKPFIDTYVLSLDKVFCHEITTPIAIIDLKKRGLDKVFDKTKIKAVIDHVSPAKDSKTAEQQKIIREWALSHGIDFYDIGKNGVCHALFSEKGFVLPGEVVVMGDSHTCTYGAFGAFAAGIGTTDLEVAIMKGVSVFKEPKTIRINLTGRLADGVFAKDVILFLLGKIGVNGATDCVIEFCGDIVDNLSMEGRMTLCNMAVEMGATSGICFPDMKTIDYLWQSIKGNYQSKNDALKCAQKWISDENAVYEKNYEFDLSNLSPMVTFNYKPDNVMPIMDMAYTKVDQVYIGSCTNGRIEDLRIASSVLKGKKIAKNVRGIVCPATTEVYKAALKEGILDIFVDSGFCITSPGCGACIGMSNGVLCDGEVCASTTNRNFYGRMGKGGMIYLMSPASAAATSISGYITNSNLYKTIDETKK